MVLVMKNLKLGKIPAQVHFENTLKSSYSCIGNMSALLSNITARYYQKKNVDRLCNNRDKGRS